jgi:hypothetical protein
MIIWPPSPVLRHDTIPTSHRTRFPVNARGYMASVLSCESVAPLPSGSKKEPLRGRTGERRVSGRVTGVDARHRRRGMRGGVAGRYCCIRRPPRGCSSASAARWYRRTRPNAERRRLDTGGRPGTRVIRRGYPSIRRPETESDLRMRGWGWICIRPSRDSDANSGPFAERHWMRTRRITQEK